MAVCSAQTVVSGQALLIPSPAGFTQGEGECSDIQVAIASPNWRVRKGDGLEVSAVHPLTQRDGLTYTWEVANGRIVSGQGTPKIALKAGGGKTPGYINASGLVSISVRVKRGLSSGGCGVKADHSVMIGRIREVNSFANVDRVSIDEEFLVLPSPPGCMPREAELPSKDLVVDVVVTATDLENDPLGYAYFVSGGRIVGQGSKVKWDLTDVQPGDYKILVAADDGMGILGKTVVKRVTVRECDAICDIACPSITIHGPKTLEEESVFTANVSRKSNEYHL